jgi:hypothetical protein
MIQSTDKAGARLEAARALEWILGHVGPLPDPLPRAGETEQEASVRWEKESQNWQIREEEICGYAYAIKITSWRSRPNGMVEPQTFAFAGVPIRPGGGYHPLLDAIGTDPDGRFDQGDQPRTRFIGEIWGGRPEYDNHEERIQLQCRTGRDEPWEELPLREQDRRRVWTFFSILLANMDFPDYA